jgi:hypothetical protein
LDGSFGSEELAFGIYGLMNMYLMAHLIVPAGKLDRPSAERVVRLFLSGAAARRAPGARVTGRRPVRLRAA